HSGCASTRRIKSCKSSVVKGICLTCRWSAAARYRTQPNYTGERFRPQTPASPGAMLWRRLRLLLRGRGRPYDTIEPRCESLVDARHLKLPDKVRIGYRLTHCLCNSIKVLGTGLDQRHDLRCRKSIIHPSQWEIKDDCIPGNARHRYVASA